MTKTLSFRNVIFFLGSLFFSTKTFSCSCPAHASVKDEFNRSALVIQGRIVGMDTIYSSSYLVYDKHGIKYGKHKYSLHYEHLVRAKILVEKNFKSSPGLPDTIFVLTPLANTACGDVFSPYLSYIWQQFPSYYDYIVYADRWTENSIEKLKIGRRTKKVIKRSFQQTVFYTTRCSRSRSVNNDELSELEKIKS